MVAIMSNLPPGVRESDPYFWRDTDHCEDCGEQHEEIEPCEDCRRIHGRHDWRSCSG